MKYLNHGLAEISTNELLEKSNHILEMMSENTHFTQPYPSLSEISNITQELASIQEKIDNGYRNQIPLLQEKFVCLKRKIKQLGTYVVLKSQGNPFIVKSSGYIVSDVPEVKSDSVQITEE